MSPCDIFIQNYIDENGCSDVIFIEDLIKEYGEQFQSNNGCQWARKGSKLDKNYILTRFQAKDLGGKGNKVVAIQVSGFRESIENHSIPVQIRRSLKNTPCAVLGVITSEIDNKNGKYKSEEYQKEDFQSLTKSVNDAKREHCKRCNASKQRFKASVLGYSVDFIEGDENSPTCQGCYWYDPQFFNHTVSANYIKK